jgi:hypothetical protein
MGRECKHQWRLAERHVLSITGKTVYIFYCIKCLHFRKIATEIEKNYDN